MKIEILLLGLAASVAIALPARNHTGTPSIPARNSTRTSPNTTSAQGCKPATLRWWRSFTTAAQYDSLFSFTVAGNYYRGAILPHEDPLRFERFCSEDEAFCVTHSFGPSIIDVFILFAGREYYHKEPDKIHKYQLGQRDWDVEFWDCVVV